MRRVLTVASCALLAVACARRTELVIGVATDLDRPGEIDEVTLTVKDAFDTPLASNTWPVNPRVGGYTDLPGSIGLMPSASLNEKGFGLYEPCHGSAPDIAGSGKANPIATILSAAMMLRLSFDLPDAAAAVEQAVDRVIAEGARTSDIAQPGEPTISTQEMGARIAAAI